VRDVRQADLVDAESAAMHLVRSADPLATELGLRTTASVLRAAMQQRRTVTVVSGPEGAVDGVCVMATTPRRLRRSAAGLRGWRVMSRMPWLPPSSAAIVFLSGARGADDRGVDRLLTAALAELGDHDVEEVVALEGSGAPALRRCGFLPRDTGDLVWR
jgi:hypothetical protein